MYGQKDGRVETDRHTDKRTIIIDQWTDRRKDRPINRHTDSQNGLCELTVTEVKEETDRLTNRQKKQNTKMTKGNGGIISKKKEKK